MDFPTLNERLLKSLREDKAFFDITTGLIPRSRVVSVNANVIAREKGVFCGAFLIRPLFRLLSPRVRIVSCKRDGQRLSKGQTLARLTGPVSAILGGERLFLNLAGHLSGIATMTDRYVKRLKGTGVAVTDTRKTTPLWRDVERWAVRCGGGINHRNDLKDAVLVKDNHTACLEKYKLSPARLYSQENIRRLRKGKPRFVEMEAKTHREVWTAIKARADWVLLDNMNPRQIREALILIRAARAGLKSDSPKVEVSGGVNLENIRSYAIPGVDRISVGALTHSAPALDLSMEVT